MRRTISGSAPLPHTALQPLPGGQPVADPHSPKKGQGVPEWEEAGQHLRIFSASPSGVTHAGGRSLGQEGLLGVPCRQSVAGFFLASERDRVPASDVLGGGRGRGGSGGGGGLGPEGTLGYVTCALAANSTKAQKENGLVSGL